MINYFLLGVFISGYVVCLIMSHNSFFYGFWTQVALHTVGLGVSICILYLLGVLMSVAG